MDDTQKMLQIIINGQSSLKQELSTKIDKLDAKFEGKIDKLGTELNAKIDKLDKRLDKIGKQVAFLEDDAPTREEFDGLTKRVDKIEKKVVVTPLT
ncbi:MAG: hypothetical protein PHQ59_05695 [Candidatus Daviesbacteria bacterium]|nr:hypothetical protein [Candidatus Daviesbacteria bacterium]